MIFRTETKHVRNQIFYPGFKKTYNPDMAIKVLNKVKKEIRYYSYNGRS